jgi:hypothetical protein
MISGKTKSGFEFNLDDEAMNDMELLEDLKKLDSGDVLAVPSILERMLGKQKDDLYNHVRTESGRVPIDALVEELKGIFETSKDAKN